MTSSTDNKILDFDIDLSIEEEIDGLQIYSVTLVERIVQLKKKEESFEIVEKEQRYLDEIYSQIESLKKDAQLKTNECLNEQQEKLVQILDFDICDDNFSHCDDQDFYDEKFENHETKKYLKNTFFSKNKFQELEMEDLVC